MKPTTTLLLEQKIQAVLVGGDILLVVPPFAGTNQSILGPHILQALAQELGYAADILYMNLLLASEIGLEQYDPISCEERFRLLGERMFARSAYGIAPLGSRTEACLDEALSIDGDCRQHRMFYDLPGLDLDALFDIEERCLKFLDSVAAILASYPYSIIGCSTSYEQTNCSIALLHRIKTLRPEIVTLLGGANCEAALAEGIASLSESVDYIFSGDSEESFCEFLQQYRNGHLPTSRIFAGSAFHDLDRIPSPDYSAFFTQLTAFFDEDAPKNVMLCYESSRGCAKGEYEPCAFCALNGDKRIVFRQKTATKVLTELETLAVRHPDIPIWMVDNLMPVSYYQDLLPALCENAEGPSLYYEQRADLSLSELRQLQQAGIKGIQPGIESFSPGLLALMKKGLEARHTVLVLRNAFSVGLQVYWNLLWGFPGDSAAHYEEMLRLLPLLRHLHPPIELRHLRLDRFSAYHARPQDFRIENLRPFAAYHDIYPEDADIGKLAYYFRADYPCGVYQEPNLIQQLDGEVKQWKRRWKKATLCMKLLGEAYTIYDSRKLNGTVNVYTLDKAQAKEIMICQPFKNSKSLQWAVAEKLGVVMDGWYVPLVTADVELLLEFEGEQC